MKRNLLTTLIILCAALSLKAQQQIDLAGTWQFAIDRNDQGENEHWFEHKKFDDTILLPGSMPQRLKGDDVTVNTPWTATLYDSSFYYNPQMERYRRTGGEMKLPFFLTPDKHYVGKAWYKRSVNIPKAWRDQRILLSLERPHIETTLWVNGKLAGTANSLCVPHVYDLTAYLHTGTNDLTLCVDNRPETVNVGNDSHSVSDQTQGNWNGIVGGISLTALPQTHIQNLQVYPDIEKREAKVVMQIESEKEHCVSLNLQTESFNTDQPTQRQEMTKDVMLKHGANEVVITLPMGESPYLWDEFHPTLYRLTATLTKGKLQHRRHTEFGMRQFSIHGKWFYVNGRKTQLRGTVENCDFPLTGYAPMDTASWERVFRICRNYGLNHMRFHSYCPPRAAFVAADRIGFYLQPEGPSWPNHGVKLGVGQPIDKYLMDETISLNREYGNHASFCMLACGNEPAGRWVDWVTDFVHYWQQADSRHVYTGASVGGGWAWQPASEYHVKAGARGLEWARKQPESWSTFSNKIDTVSQPFVSHETGQWNCYPNFNEIRKYTGVNKAKNFEIFRDLLADNHMSHQAQDFLMASGKLQVLCYKHEIEKTLRTPDYAGFQLLSLNDYSGQGSAIVGILDVFFGEKGYIKASEWLQFCSPTVPLARLERFVYTDGDTLYAAIELNHFGEAPLRNADFLYILRTTDGKIIHTERSHEKEIPIGGQFALKEFRHKLKALDNRPQELTLEVRLTNCDNYAEVRASGTDYTEHNYPVREVKNQWSLWVYPQREPVTINNPDLLITDTLDDQAIGLLERGGKVLLTAAGRVKYGSGIVQHFVPTFWNTSWFKMRPPHTIGSWIDDAHPLFRHFPTSYYTNLQWWELTNRAQCMMTDHMGENFHSIVQPIDTWFLSRRLSTMFEARVLNGKLIMTSLDVQRHNKRFVARELMHALLSYMQSDNFRPTQTVTVEQIETIFNRPTPAVDSYTKDSPDELKPRLK